MDTAVATAVTTALGTFKTDALTQFGAIIPVAAALLITVGVTFFAIKLFRAIAHV